jgi:hypothetical protein
MKSGKKSNSDSHLHDEFLTLGLLCSGVMMLTVFAVFLSGAVSSPLSTTLTQLTGSNPKLQTGNMSWAVQYGGYPSYGSLANGGIQTSADGYPAPLGCEDAANDACVKAPGVYNTFGVFDAFEPSNPSNGTADSFTSTVAANTGRYDINAYNHPVAWVDVLTRGGSIVVYPAGQVRLQWVCQPYQYDYYYDNCGFLGLSQCLSTYAGTNNTSGAIPLFNGTSGNGTTGTRTGNQVIVAPGNGQSATYKVQCTGATGNGPVMPITLTGAYPPPTATISSNAPSKSDSTNGGFGQYPTVSIGGTMNITATYSPDYRDTLVASNINSPSVLIPCTSVTPSNTNCMSVPDTSKVFSFSTTTPGIYTFNAGMQVTRYAPGVTQNYSSIDVQVSCPSPTVYAPPQNGQPASCISATPAVAVDDTFNNVVEGASSNSSNCSAGFFGIGACPYFTVSRIGNQNAPQFSVTLTFGGGTAVQGTDYGCSYNKNQNSFGTCNFGNSTLSFSPANGGGGGGGSLGGSSSQKLYFIPAAVGASKTVQVTVPAGTGYLPAAAPDNTDTITIVPYFTQMSLGVSSTSIAQGVAASASVVTVTRAALKTGGFPPPAPPATPLTVNWTLSGVVAGSDYTMTCGSGITCSANSITIPANKSSATVTITPGPTAFQGSKTLNIQLMPSSAYTVNSGTAAITIVGSIQPPPPPPPTSGISNFTGNPSRVRSGGYTTLTWTGSSLTSCSLDSNPRLPGFPQDVSADLNLDGSGGTASNIGPISQTTIFTLTCMTASSKTTISTVPVYKEQ